MPEDASGDKNKEEGLKREAEKEEDLERKRLKKEENKTKESDKKPVCNVEKYDDVDFMSIVNI